jgi:glycosyltransferase involved in cell wall biosynthesis
LARFLIVQPYLDVYGGSERVCHNVIKSLIAHGESAELLTFNFDASKYLEIAGEEFPKEVAIHSLGEKVEFKPPFTVYKRHSALARLMKKFRDSLEYDYLFSTQSSSPFEPVFLNKAKKNIAYVHFPEIHYSYDHSRFRRKVYLWLIKKWVEQGISKLDMVFCNSNYTKEMIERYWKPYGVKDPIVVYPPVALNNFWCDTPLSQRQKRVMYVARFIPAKRHELMKRLAADLPAYEFVSVGGLLEGEKDWFTKFQEDLPKNYTVKVNLPSSDLIKVLHDSRVYVHLMEGEHFGIAPVEALASGCITLVHNSGGIREFIPKEFRWEHYADLKEKIVQSMESAQESLNWEEERKELWSKIAALNAENFQNNIWSNIQSLIKNS